MNDEQSAGGRNDNSNRNRDNRDNRNRDRESEMLEVVERISDERVPTPFNK
jgi:hypothetical protein